MPEETVDPAVAADLKDLETRWKAGKDFEPPSQPQGTFRAVIADATLGRSQASDRLQIAYTLEIAVGEHKGTVVRKFDGLETPQQTQMTQSSLAQLGVKADSLQVSQLPAILLSLKGKEVVIRTKRNGTFFNVYFVRVVVPPVTAPKATVPGPSTGPATACPPTRLGAKPAFGA